MDNNFWSVGHVILFWNVKVKQVFDITKLILSEFVWHPHGSKETPDCSGVMVRLSIQLQGMSQVKVFSKHC